MRVLFWFLRSFECGFWCQVEGFSFIVAVGDVFSSLFCCPFWVDFPYVDRFSQFHSVYFYFHDPGGHVFCAESWCSKTESLESWWKTPNLVKRMSRNVHESLRGVWNDCDQEIWNQGVRWAVQAGKFIPYCPSFTLSTADSDSGRLWRMLKVEHKYSFVRPNQVQHKTPCQTWNVVNYSNNPCMEYLLYLSSTLKTTPNVGKCSIHAVSLAR